MCRWLHAPNVLKYGMAASLKLLGNVFFKSFNLYQRLLLSFLVFSFAHVFLQLRQWSV